MKSTLDHASVCFNCYIPLLLRVIWFKTYGHNIIKLISLSLSFISPLFSCVFYLLERGWLLCSQSSNAWNICHQKVKFQTHFVRPKSRHLSMSRTTRGWDAFVHRHGATCCSLEFHTGLWNIHSDCEGIAGQRVPSFLKKRGCEQFLWIHCYIWKKRLTLHGQPWPPSSSEFRIWRIVKEHSRNLRQ